VTANKLPNYMFSD